MRDVHALPLLLALGLLAGGASTAEAQQPGGALPTGGGQEEVVDQVAAVVGDSAILLSEIREEAFRRQQQGARIPEARAARDSFYREILQSMIQERMLLEAAERRGITVSEEQVEQLTRDRLNQMEGSFRSRSAFQQAVEETGRSMVQFRQMVRSAARKELVIQTLQQQLQQSEELPPAEVSEGEIRRAFEQQAQGRQRPATITFDRVMLVPKPDSARSDSARQLAREALEEIRSGTEFAVVARRYSDDENSRQRGGDLGWIRRSDVAPSFARAAWSASPGRAVGPLGSRFGWHVLEIENIRGGERKVRHVLVQPEFTEEDIEQARELAASLADSLADGASPDRLAREHGLAGKQVRFDEVRVSELRGRLGRPYVDALTEPPPSPDEVRGPFRVEGSFGVPAFVVTKIEEHNPSGEYTLEDLREQIRESLIQQKQFSKFVERLRDQVYVRVLL